MKTQAPRRSTAKKASSDRATEGSPAVLALGAAVSAAARRAVGVLGSPAFGRTFIAGLVAAGFAAASWRARAHVQEQPSQQIDRRELANIALPGFLAERARADLANLELPEKVSAFHPGLVPTLAAQLSRIPWVDSVDWLTLGFDGTNEDGEKLVPRVRFALRVAKPIARIDERGLEVLVARSRRRIPLEDVQPAARALPRIEGLGDDVEREARLDAALGLVAALEKNGLASRLGLETVALSGKEATLALTSGVKVDFGPVASTPSLTIEARLAQLELFLQRGPALESVERLSVRWDDPVYALRPVVEPVAAAK